MFETSCLNGGVPQNTLRKTVIPFDGGQGPIGSIPLIC